MYIKASGTALKDMSATAGWRKMDTSAVLSIIEDKRLAKLEASRREVDVVNRLLCACVDTLKDGSRPSVEAHLHAILDRCVIHLHPEAVGAYVCCKEGKARLEKLFSKEKYPPLWVPYTDPGLMLGRKVARLVRQYRIKYGCIPSILFLEKHGLFVSAGTPRKALSIVRKVVNTCNNSFKYPRMTKRRPIDGKKINSIKLAIRKAVFKAVGEYKNVVYFDDDITNGFANRSSTKQLLSKAALTPDELVYANGSSVWVDDYSTKKIYTACRKVFEKNSKCPCAFLVKGTGLFVCSDIRMSPVIRDVQVSSLLVRHNAQRLGGIKPLNKRELGFINNWEAEAFRKQLTTGSTAGQLKGRIGIVTGAGSGLGRSIAIGLARAGAMVALADIDKAAAEQTAEMIKDEMPGALALIVACNVTDEANVESSYQKLLNEWGGLDILVNAAGLAPAYPLVETPVEKWRLALEVNLTGYLLMAKHASRIFIEQGMGGSIINLSSKSGLGASKNNTAYNATKAGELHMARGWAMELGEHNIRVNCVCPGNVFEGSKIWNPTYIKACAKKYGIEPEEVIPYYVNKTMLKREIKGQDIADSVVFLCSDRAQTITGQVVVADSGQVMVR
jgi:NAD(P)-dependent dehydrogenase (short-subunit alcohol dehydrogenase family)/rhamnose utilization protein RhaD (predicted bifunctional aldolase and dehydrogenase)